MSAREVRVHVTGADLDGAVVEDTVAGALALRGVDWRGLQVSRSTRGMTVVFTVDARSAASARKAAATVRDRFATAGSVVR